MSEELLEMRSYIKSQSRLLPYCTRVQRALNEAFTVAAVLSSRLFSLESTTSSVVLGVVSSLTSSLPLASAVFSATASGIDLVAANRLVGKYRNMAEISPGGDPIQTRYFCEMLASYLTLTSRGGSEDLQPAKKSFLSSAVKTVSSQVSKLDPALSRGLFQLENSEAEELGMTHAKLAVDYILGQTPSELVITRGQVSTGDYQGLAGRIVRAVLGRDPQIQLSSQKMGTSSSPTHSQSSASTAVAIAAVPDSNSNSELDQIKKAMEMVRDN
jgi:hypothetical protein